MANPVEAYWSVVQRLLHYLSGRSAYRLLISPSGSTPKFSLRVYSDSDWASDPDDRMPTSGSCLCFGLLLGHSCSLVQIYSHGGLKSNFKLLSQALKPSTVPFLTLRQNFCGSSPCCLNSRLPSILQHYSVTILVQFYCLTILFYMPVLSTLS